MLLFGKKCYKPEQYLNTNAGTHFGFSFVCFNLSFLVNSPNPFTFLHFWFQVSLFPRLMAPHVLESPRLSQASYPLHTRAHRHKYSYLGLLSFITWKSGDDFPCILITSLLPFPSLDMRDKISGWCQSNCSLRG